MSALRHRGANEVVILSDGTLTNALSLHELEAAFEPPGPDTSIDLAQRFKGLARDLKHAGPRRAFDWFFPSLYARMTHRTLDACRDNAVNDPRWVRELGDRFACIYLDNAKASFLGEHTELGWKIAAGLSILLSRCPLWTRDAVLSWKTILQGLFPIHVHIVVDLPRAMVNMHSSGDVDDISMKRKSDYFFINRFIDPVIQETLGELDFSLGRPVHNSGIIRGAMIKTMASYVRFLRLLAWWRYRYLAKTPQETPLESQQDSG